MIKQLIPTSETVLKAKSHKGSQFLGFLVNTNPADKTVEGYLKNGRTLIAEVDEAGIDRFVNCPAELRGQMMAELMERYPSAGLDKYQVDSNHPDITLDAHQSSHFLGFNIKRLDGHYSLLTGMLKTGRNVFTIVNNENRQDFLSTPKEFLGEVFGKLVHSK